jgi:hypothetical protein
MYEYMMRLFSDIGKHVSKVDADSPEDSPDTEAVDLAAWFQRLQAIGFPSHLIRLTLAAEFPMRFGRVAIASFGELDKGFSCGFDSFVKGFDRAYFQDMAERTWTKYPFEYGYAVQLRRQGSSWHYGSAAIGDISDYYRRSPAIAMRTRWQKHWTRTKGARQLLGGVFRDIYPINFLNELHLDARLQTQSVGAWILADPKRGSLTRLNDKIWTWSLPHLRVRSVRRVFIEAGLLIAYRE